MRHPMPETRHATRAVATNMFKHMRRASRLVLQSFMIVAAAACGGGDRVTGLQPSTDPTVATTPIDGLVAYYPFDGNADDASGKASNGVVSGATPTTDRFGKANRAFFFDGVSASISTTTTHFTQTNQLTVSLWVNASSQDLRYFATSSDFGIFWEHSSVGLAINHPSTNSASGLAGTGGWVHFVGTFDGNTIKAYVNGQLAGSTSWPGTLSNFDRPLVFGQFGSAYWRGSLDDVRIFNRVLSMDEIQQLLHEGGWTLAGSQYSRWPRGGSLGVSFLPTDRPY